MSAAHWLDQWQRAREAQEPAGAPETRVQAKAQLLPGARLLPGKARVSTLGWRRDPAPDFDAADRAEAELARRCER